MEQTIKHNVRAKDFQAEMEGLSSAQIIDAYGKHILETALLSNALSSIDWFVKKLIDSGADTSLITPSGDTIKDFALNISNRDYSKYFNERTE